MGQQIIKQPDGRLAVFSSFTDTGRRMGQQIIKQPDGRLAVFSSFTDTFVLMDATPDEVVEWFGERAAETERDRTRTVLGHVLADNPRAAYFQFARTWEEACQLNREHGGDLTYIGEDATR